MAYRRVMVVQNAKGFQVSRLILLRHLKKRGMSQASNCLKEGVRISRERESSGTGEAKQRSVLRIWKIEVCCAKQGRQRVRYAK